MICENCGKTYDKKYGSGRFCSQECARQYATKYDNKLDKKIAYCKQCGNILYINKRASINNCICDKCKKEIEKICPICGKKYTGTKNQKICSNECKHIKRIIPTLQKYFSLNVDTIGTKYIFTEIKKITNLLYTQYWEEKKSFSDLAKIYNYTGNPGNFTKIFKALNIDRRDQRNAQIESYINNKHKSISANQYKCCWHTTWNNKEVYLRSSYELDYAKELDEQQIDYDVECLRIKYFDTQKREYRCAIPDFYLPETNTIVEIKSDYTLDIQNMKDKFKAYKELGYNTKLICEHQDISPLPDKEQKE